MRTATSVPVRQASNAGSQFRTPASSALSRPSLPPPASVSPACPPALPSIDEEVTPEEFFRQSLLSEGLDVDKATERIQALGWRGEDPSSILPTTWKDLDTLQTFVTSMVALTQDRTVAPPPIKLNDLQPASISETLERRMKSLPSMRRKSTPSQGNSAGHDGLQERVDNDEHMEAEPMPPVTTQHFNIEDTSLHIEMEDSFQEPHLPVITVTPPSLVPVSPSLDTIMYDGDMTDLPRATFTSSSSWLPHDTAAPLHPQDVDCLLLNGLFDQGFFVDSEPTSVAPVVPNFVAEELVAVQPVFRPEPTSPVATPYEFPDPDCDMTDVHSPMAALEPLEDEPVHEVIDEWSFAPGVLPAPQKEDWYQNISESSTASLSSTRKNPVSMQFVLSPTTDTLGNSHSRRRKQRNTAHDRVGAFLLMSHLTRRDIAPSYPRANPLHQMGQTFSCYAAGDESDSDEDSVSESESSSADEVDSHINIRPSMSNTDKDDTSSGPDTPNPTPRTGCRELLQTCVIFVVLIWALLWFLLHSII